jgi:succinyl-diaminopimelate desuccinylase
MSAIERLKHLVACESVTPDDGGALDLIASWLPHFEAIRLDKGDVKNLLLRKVYGESELHLAFAGHVDVVPAGKGWESNPFELTQRDGYLYGRGTQDMKSGVAAFVEAVSSLKDFSGTLSLILTSDEEGDGIDGTDVVLQWMKEKNSLPQMCIVAEPTCETLFGDAIKVGRRGSINGKLLVKGLGGHAAYPQKAINPIEKVASLLPLLSNVDLDGGDEFFAPSRLVMTTLHAGQGTTNVIPHDLTLLFNVRNNTLTTQQRVEEFVRDALTKAMINDYELEIKQSSYPFVTKEGKHSLLLTQTLRESIIDVTGVEPKSSTSGGTSDARYVAKYGIDVIEFGVKNDTIHAPNERTTIEEVENLSKVFSVFLNRL